MERLFFLFVPPEKPLFANTFYHLDLEDSVFDGVDRQSNPAFYLKFFKKVIAITIYCFRTQVHFFCNFAICIVTTGVPQKIRFAFV